MPYPGLPDREKTKIDFVRYKRQGGNMNDSKRFMDQGMWSHAFIAFAVYMFLFASTAAAGDLLSTICNNEVVSVGDRKAVVLAKCGKPLSNFKDTTETEASQTVRKKKTYKKQTDKNKVKAKRKTVKESDETWTYNIDGSYRFFIFKEGKLSGIETGGLAD